MTRNRPRCLRVLAPIALVVVGLAGSACKAPSPLAANVYEFEEGAHEVTETLSNRGFARDVQISDPLTQRRADRLYIQFDLYNTRQSVRPLEYIVHWYNAERFEVSSLHSWQPLVLGAGSKKTISMAAPTPAVVRWRLQVRPSN